nr:hypothetical protein HK105_005312 [Polyrhizophydium stewartii]
MAAAAGARIVAFNIPCERRILSQAQAERISIHQHQIIYSLVDNLKEIMADMLPPEIIKEVLGEAEVLQLFSINVRGKQTEMIAGCRITNGKLARNSTLRVLRGGETVFEGTVKTLKHHKKDITEASKGLECGLALEGFDGFQAGDTIQAIKTTERRRTID